MPLELLVALVLGGIAAIALLLHLSGRSEPLRFDEDAARAHWLRHFPGDRITALRIARSQRAVLVETPRGPGLMWAFGADSVARRLEAPRIETVSGGLRVRFADWSAPAVRLALSPEEIEDWPQRMRPQ